MNLEIVKREIEATAIIIIGIKDVKNNNLNILFDIGVNKNVNLNMESIDIWDNLDKLRDFKNDIFFKSLTEKTLGIYR